MCQCPSCGRRDEGNHSLHQCPNPPEHPPEPPPRHIPTWNDLSMLWQGVVDALEERGSGDVTPARVLRDWRSLLATASGDVIAPDRTAAVVARELAHAALDLFISANIAAQHSGGLPEAEWSEKMRAISIGRHRLEDAMMEAWLGPHDNCVHCGSSLAIPRPAPPPESPSGNLPGVTGAPPVGGG